MPAVWFRCMVPAYGRGKRADFPGRAERAEAFYTGIMRRKEGGKSAGGGHAADRERHGGSICAKGGDDDADSFGRLPRPVARVTVANRHGALDHVARAPACVRGITDVGGPMQSPALMTSNAVPRKESRSSSSGLEPAEMMTESAL